MKLRVEFLGLRHRDWTVNEGQKDERKGTTYFLQVILTDGEGDALLMKIPEKLHMQIMDAKYKRLAVIDLVHEPRVVLQNNQYGKPEQLLKILPVGVEWVADSLEDLQTRPGAVRGPLSSVFNNKPADEVTA